MRWECPKCHGKSLIPGKCLLCNETLQPAAQMPKVVQRILNDPKALRATLELANTLAKKLFKVRKVNG